MKITCSDRERIFADGSAEEWVALKAHAADCANCAEEIHAWESLSLAAQELKRDWDSSALWPRIQRALAEQSKPKRSFLERWLEALKAPSLNWQTAAASLLLLVLTGSAAWMGFRRGPGIDEKARLLSNSTVNEVERAEAAYVRAIDKLDAEARPQLDNPASPLIASYREKLLVLDSAIAELRMQAGQNPANGHLRRQLLAMYQEKQDTLEQVLEEKK